MSSCDRIRHCAPRTLSTPGLMRDRIARKLRTRSARTKAPEPVGRFYSNENFPLLLGGQALVVYGQRVYNSDGCLEPDGLPSIGMTPTMSTSPDTASPLRSAERSGTMRPFT